MITFVVYGIPAPKGSKSAFPIRRKTGKMGAVVVEGKTERQADWKHRVEAVVQELAAEGTRMLDGPLQVDVTFYLPRPASAPKARWAPDRKPDIDKLLRALLDPMSGVLIADDARIVRICADKRYDPTPRAQVGVWQLRDIPTEEDTYRMREAMREAYQRDLEHGDPGPIARMDS